MKSVRDWIAIAITLGTWLFLGGQFYFRVQSLEAAVVEMREELARKDVLEERLTGLSDQIKALDRKIDTLIPGNRQTAR